MIREITQNEVDELEGKVWNELFRTDIVVTFPSVKEQ